MAEIRRGRFSAEIDGDFVVLPIGPQFTEPWPLPKTLGDLPGRRRGMTAMLDELVAPPEKGQWWRSADHLDASARDPGDLHRPTRREYFGSDPRGRTGNGPAVRGVARP